MDVVVKEQESYVMQKKQFEEQLRGEGPNPVEDDEERFMLEEMIAELVEKIPIICWIMRISFFFDCRRRKKRAVFPEL